jgi:hypothetical protein
MSPRSTPRRLDSTGASDSVMHFLQGKLRKAASLGDADMVQRCLAMGMDPDTEDEVGGWLGGLGVHFLHPWRFCTSNRKYDITQQSRQMSRTERSS